MRWKTRITDLLGIDYPIMEGAMAGLGTVELAVAVSNAGGLGTITAWMLRKPERLRKAIREARSMTRRPFAVNFSPTMDPILHPMLDVAIEERVPVIETAASRAVEYGEKIKGAGLVWIHKAQTVRHALAAERDGADAVCMMGLEGAGLKSPNVLPTLVTIPLAAKKLGIPIIAAGGIGDARGFLGALALGADAVQLGSVFCAVKECKLSAGHKEALIEADPYDPRWRDPILTTPKPEDLRKIMTARSTKEVLKAAGKAEDFGIPREAGTGAISLAIGHIDAELSARELMEKMIHEAEEILRTRGIGGWTLSGTG